MTSSIAKKKVNVKTGFHKYKIREKCLQCGCEIKTAVAYRDAERNTQPYCTKGCAAAARILNHANL